MTWFLTCGALELFIDEKGQLEYRAEVRNHKATAMDQVPYGGTNSPVARLNSTTASLQIFCHGTGWRGALGAVNSNLHSPILGDETTAKVVVFYSHPSAEFAGGTAIVDIFLPRQRFELVGAKIEQAMQSDRITMSVNFDFNGFRATPADWATNPLATEEQFFAESLLERHPYVSDRVRFFFSERQSEAPT